MIVNWRKWNRAIHRDVGYFVTGTITIYALSGIAVNHIDDWNPNFIVERTNIAMEVPKNRDKITKTRLEEQLESLGFEIKIKAFDFPSKHKLKIYSDEGSIVIHLDSGKGVIETIRRRPMFYNMNQLHVNPKGWWLGFSDAFSISLIFLALSGLILLKGKNGVLGRGKWFIGAGIMVPLFFIFVE